jgi:hypothetical protein
MYRCVLYDEKLLALGVLGTGARCSGYGCIAMGSLGMALLHFFLT